MEIQEFKLYTKNLDVYDAYDIKVMKFMNEIELEKYQFQLERDTGELSQWHHIEAVFGYKKIIKDLEERVNDLIQERNHYASLYESKSAINQKLSNEIDVSENLNKLQILVYDVLTWSMNKGLNKQDPNKQALKLFEEVGEVASGLTRNDLSAIEDGIGDTVVTLIILAQQLGLSFEGCLETAYEEFKDRTGEMVNGIFVK